MITVVSRDPLSIKFQLNDEKSIIIYGYNDKRAPEESLLINGGTSRITRIVDGDWDCIIAKYGHMAEFKFNIIFAMEKEKDAKVKAKELITDFSHLEMSETFRKNISQVDIDLDMVV